MTNRKTIVRKPTVEAAARRLFKSRDPLELFEVTSSGLLALSAYPLACLPMNVLGQVLELYQNEWPVPSGEVKDRLAEMANNSRVFALVLRMERDAVVSAGVLRLLPSFNVPGQQELKWVLPVWSLEMMTTKEGHRGNGHATDIVAERLRLVRVLADRLIRVSNDQLLMGAGETTPAGLPVDYDEFRKILSGPQIVIANVESPGHYKRLAAHAMNNADPQVTRLYQQQYGVVSVGDDFIECRFGVPKQVEDYLTRVDSAVTLVATGPKSREKIVKIASALELGEPTFTGGGQKTYAVDAAEAVRISKEVLKMAKQQSAHLFETEAEMAAWLGTRTQNDDDLYQEVNSEQLRVVTVIR